MSTICIVQLKHYDSFANVKETICQVAAIYERGVDFELAWEEPLFDELLVDGNLLCSLTDHPMSENCEMLLLPDGCYFNGICNNLPFVDRMRFLQDLSDILAEKDVLVEFYIGLSGTPIGEFDTIKISKENLLATLNTWINKSERDYAIHLVVN